MNIFTIILCAYFLFSLIFLLEPSFIQNRKHNLFTRRLLTSLIMAETVILVIKKCEDKKLYLRLLDERPFMIINNKKLKIFEIP